MSSELSLKENINNFDNHILRHINLKMIKSVIFSLYAFVFPDKISTLHVVVQPFVDK